MQETKKEHKEWEDKLKQESKSVTKPHVRWLRYNDGMMVLQMLTPAGQYIDVNESFPKSQ